MSGVSSTVRINSALSDLRHELGALFRQVKAYIVGLDTAEQMVLLGLLMIGLFYLVLNHFQRREDTERAGARFAGLIFVMVAVAAGFGLTVSGHTT